MKDPLVNSVVRKEGVEDNKSFQVSISCNITIVRECRFGTSEAMFRRAFNG